MDKRKWQLVYYELADESVPVKDFIDGLDELEQAKAFNWMRSLGEKGPTFPRPYADYLRDGIYELRLKLSGDNERILYFFCFKDFIVLTHQPTKHTKKVPDGDIEIALQRKTNFYKQYKTKEELIKALRKKGCLCVV